MICKYDKTVKFRRTIPVLPAVKNTGMQVCFFGNTVFVCFKLLQEKWKTFFKRFCVLGLKIAVAVSSPQKVVDTAPEII